MKLLIGFCLTLLSLSFAFGSLQGDVINRADVRVRLVKGQGEMVLVAKFLSQALAAKDIQKQSENFILCKGGNACRVRFFVDSNAKGGFFIEAGGVRRGPFKKIELNGTDILWGSKRLPARLSVQERTSKIDVIGKVDIESYVAGVVASEMPIQWPVETLKAQAVAARSYALQVIKERRKQAYDVESSVMDQVFNSVDLNQDRYRFVKQAVFQTQGQVLIVKNEILKAFYHSHCGGRTASARTVWRSAVDSGQATDKYCAVDPNSNIATDGSAKRWSFRISKSLLNTKFKNWLGEKEPVEVELQLAHLDLVNGRIVDVPVRISSSAKKMHVEGNTLRALVGFEKIKSMNFKVKSDGDDWIFNGNGFGHGVGLCQWGSRTLGKQGYSYLQILKHYYPVASVSVHQIATN